MIGRALVTGGSGFLGRHLVTALADRIGVVDVLDLRPSPDPLPGDLLHGDARQLLPELDRYDAVFHLAAAVGGRGGLERSPATVAGNLALDAAFFAYVDRCRPEHAVYLSSSAVYGAGRPVLRAEAAVDAAASSIDQPDGLYGWVKLTGERLAAVFGGVSRIVSYRPFTLYGPGQALDYAVPAIASRALAGDDPIEVWGSGAQVRDLVHVDDAVGAILATYRHHVGPLNVCTEVGTDFLTLAAVAARAAGRPGAAVVADPTKPNGLDHRVGDGTSLGRWFRPTIALEEGMATVVDDLRGRPIKPAAARPG